MLELYHQFIYQPLLNLLVWGYNTIPGHDMEIVSSLLALVIRIVLAPLMHKQLQSQKAMSGLQPKLNALREQHKGDKEAQAKATMELYREHKVNPLSSCLPLLIQLPILIALYQVFSKALRGNLEGLYGFVSNPGSINPLFLHFIDLSKANIYLAVIAGALQFWQSKHMMSQTGPSNDPTAKVMSIQTKYVLPLLSIFIAMTLPAGLPLYWAVMTLFAIAQQYYIMRGPSAQPMA